MAPTAQGEADLSPSQEAEVQGGAKITGRESDTWCRQQAGPGAPSGPLSAPLTWEAAWVFPNNWACCAENMGL